MLQPLAPWDLSGCDFISPLVVAGIAPDPLATVENAERRACALESQLGSLIVLPLGSYCRTNAKEEEQ
jgi:hypothetical protein